MTATTVQNWLLVIAVQNNFEQTIKSQVGGTFTSNYLNYSISFHRQVYKEIELITNDFQQNPCTWAEGDR